MIMNPPHSLPPSPSNIYTGKDFLTSHAVDQVEISSLLIVNSQAAPSAWYLRIF